VYSGVLGISGGLVTTSRSEDLDVDENPISGLYGASNGTNHIMALGTPEEEARLVPT
jgi:hypothetical protein